MKKILLASVAAVFLSLCFSEQLQAQNNLQVQFEDPSTVPDFLNVCGEPDTATVRISVAGTSSDVRQNIQATLHLFEGVQFENLLPSPGVIVDASDPTQPIFTIPDLSLTGTPSVLINYTISANCEFTDTLAINGAADVLDVWEYIYDMGPSTGIIELDNNTEYRDAFVTPLFTVSTNNPHGVAREGECYTREFIVFNGGFGFVDTLFYESVQGDGVYVSNVFANGIPVTIQKMAVNGDTVITGIIDASHFVNNTNGPNPGDGNGFINQDETVTITEEICVLDCNADLNNIYSVSWGCEGRYCNTSTTPGFVTIGEGAAEVSILNSGSVSNENAGYCKTGTNVISFSNFGSEVHPGFAAMMDIAVGIGLGNGFDIADGGFFITDVRIGSVTIPSITAMNFLDGNALFSSDPDGAGGLDDLDGDGFFDDLATGDTLEIIATYEFDCSIAQQSGADMSCPNDFGAAFSAQIEFTDQCRTRIPILESSYFSPNNTRSNVENFSDTDAFVEQDTFYIRHTQTRGAFNFDKDCGNGEEFQVTVVIPPGITPLITETRLIRNEATIPVPIKNVTISNDTLYISFDAATTFIGGDYDLILAFTGDCTANLGPTTFNTEFAYYCPSCDCKHIWFCGDLKGPQLHAEEPPCPPGTVMCPIGVQTTAFEVNRTTFGYTDNTYTTPFDQNLANKKVAISCDSVDIRIMNIVGDTPISDSVGMVISYINIDASLDTIETFLFDFANVRITNGGNEFFCTISSADLNHQTVDSTQILDFSLDNCLTGLGLTLVAGDTIEFLGHFSLNPNGPFETQFRTVPNLRGYGYFNDGGAEFSCDNFGDNFTIAKSQTVFNFPSSNAMPEGCEEKFLSYQLITVNNGFSNWFGNEYRQAIKMDSIRFVFDPAILDAFSTFEPEVSFPGHPIHGNAFYSVPGFDTVSDSVYVAYFDTLTAVPALNDVTSYSFSFRIRTVPNCKSVAGSSDGDNSYDFDAKIVFDDRYYASVIGDGSCVESLADSVASGIFYTDPPSFTLNPASISNFELIGDTAIWELRHCNVSPTADAGLTWMAVEEPLGVIEVVSMEDISVPATPVNLTFEPYGTSGSNYFAYTPALLKVDGVNPLEDRCNTIRIKALVNQCGTFPLTARVGWNCEPYSEVNWTPELYPPCEDLTEPLSVITVDPFLAANVIDQPAIDPDICDTSTIAILLRNTDRGTAFDVMTQIIIPFEGVSLIPGSFEMAYPSSAPFVAAIGDPTFVGVGSKGNIYQYDNFALLNSFLDQNGLMGSDPINPTDSNEIVIRYQFVTDCDYTSGSISYYNFQGAKGCGDATNFEAGETLPLEINGTGGSGNKLFFVNFTNESALEPNGSSTLEILAINLNSTASDTTDKVTLQLPINVTYDPASTIVVQPSTWVSNIEPELDTVAGRQVLYWCLPAGLMMNDTARFQFDVTSPAYDCNDMEEEVGLFTVARSQLFCAPTSMTCDIEEITSSNNGQLTNLPILQNVLQFNLPNVTSNCNGSGSETVTISGTIENPGVDFSAQPFIIRYYYDVDGSGDITAGDTEITNFTENGPINQNATLLFSHDVDVPFGEVCGVIVAIDTLGTGLCNDAQVPLGEPQLLNAGADQLFCENIATTISGNLGNGNCATIAGYTYSWLGIAPADVNAHLSDPSIPDPVFTIPHDGMNEDTLMYILETTRLGCATTTRDTVSIIRGLSLQIEPTDTVYILPGGSSPLGVTVTGGVGPFSYSWEPVSGINGDPNIANPIAQPMGDTDYMVTVTSAIGCIDIATVVVINSNAIIANAFPDTTVCPFQPVQLMATGGTTFEWYADTLGNPPGGNLSDPNISNPIFISSEPNATYNYNVIVSDPGFPGFADTAMVTINTLSLPDIQIIQTPPATQCAGEQITLDANGADNYTWTVGGLQIGTGPQLIVSPTVTTTYEVFGPNAQGCFDTTLVTVNVIPLPDVLTPILDMSNCGGDTIPVSIQINENILAYTISGTGIVQNDMIINNNTLVFDAIYNGGTSTFDVELTGATTNCSVIESFSITTCGCIAPILTSLTIDEPTCENSDGYAMLKVEGNESDFTYTWTPDLGIPGGDGNIRTALPAGSYIVEIADLTDPGCATIIPFVVSNEDGPNASVSTTPANCGASDGIALFTPSTLIYVWDDGDTLNTRNDLAIGTYFVTVTHPNQPDCPGILLVEIEENNSLDATVNVTVQPDCGASNGEVEILVTGGISPYSFSWPGGMNTQTGLSAGVHNVIITDSIGCSFPFTFILMDNVPPGTVTINTIGNISCFGNIDGFVDFEVNYDPGFIAPADTIITDGTNNFVNGNLPPGDYCIEITDFNGCVAGGECFTIEEPNPIEFHFIVDPGCEVNGTGSIDLTIHGGTAPYIINWADLPGSNDQEDRLNLLIGNYDLTVTDVGGCTLSDNVNIDLPCACISPQVTSIVVVETVCGVESGAATINLTTNEGGYTYDWTPDLGLSQVAGNERGWTSIW